MGGTENAVHLISDAGSEDWPRMGKQAVADRLADRIAAALS
jgi:phosphopantothenoylcysteine decarboxylase/phosphopantothenate--cysteine ligase